MLNASRLVVRMCRPGQERSSVSTRCAQAAIRCSQLSRASKSFLVWRASESVSINGRPGCSERPRDEATCCGTSIGSVREANSTHQTPCSYSARRVLATCKARRVLPEPPAPVRVRKRVVERRLLSSITARSRPMKLLNWIGRLFGLVSRCFGTGPSPCLDDRAATETESSCESLSTFEYDTTARLKYTLFEIRKIILLFNGPVKR